MEPLVDIKDVDRAFYEERLRDFLPARILDDHAHLWLERCIHSRNDRGVHWPFLVARDNAMEDLVESYRLMFPGKTVTPLVFGNALSGRDDLDGINAYVSRSAATRQWPALIFSHPAWSATEFEDRVMAGGFLGAKVYFTLAEPYLPEKELRIFDYLPHHQLEVLNRHGWLLMLHIPRDGRLKDPVNLAQLLEIENRYPAVKVIVAHVGRAYCPEDVGNAFEILAESRRLAFDITANTSEENFVRLIRAVGPKRILFGSDLPIVRMRLRRVCENGNYVNLVPRGLYGDVSGDRHMREVSGPEAGTVTFFLYEEIDAFRRAAETTGLTRADIEDVFYNNAMRWIEDARPKPVAQQLHMVWPKERLNAPPTWTVPEGYSLRTYRPADDEAYIRLMQSAGFATWSRETLQDALRKALPDGLFFVEHKATGALAATAVATHNPSPLLPFSGELGWLAGAPDHKGKGLGAIVCAAVTKRFLDAGYTDLYLRTDDFRLPAIAIYLKLGWVPLLHAPDMKERWRKVCEQLKLSLNAIHSVTL